jgi:outer membrane lipoprotein-sorting protein
MTLRADDVEARELVRKVVEALPQVPFTAKVKLSIDGGEAREIDLSHKVIDGNRSSYLTVTAPAELEGIRFLFIEKKGAPAEQYMKVAASRTVVRVAGEVRQQPFLSSTFFIADLVDPPLDAFTYAYAGEEKVGGRACKLVESVPKHPEQEVYGKTVIAIDPKDHLAMRRTFYDKKGQVLKLWTVEKVEKIDGFWTMRDQKMAHVDGHTSRLEITEIKYNAELEDSIFTPKYLLR